MYIHPYFSPSDQGGLLSSPCSWDASASRPTFNPLTFSLSWPWTLWLFTHHSGLYWFDWNRALCGLRCRKYLCWMRYVAFKRATKIKYLPRRTDLPIPLWKSEGINVNFTSRCSKGQGERVPRGPENSPTSDWEMKWRQRRGYKWVISESSAEVWYLSRRMLFWRQYWESIFMWFITNTSIFLESCYIQKFWPMLGMYITIKQCSYLFRSAGEKQVDSFKSSKMFMRDLDNQRKGNFPFRGPFIYMNPLQQRQNETVVRYILVWSLDVQISCVLRHTKHPPHHTWTLRAVQRTPQVAFSAPIALPSLLTMIILFQLLQKLYLPPYFYSYQITPQV